MVEVYAPIVAVKSSVVVVVVAIAAVVVVAVSSVVVVAVTVLLLLDVHRDMLHDGFVYGVRHVDWLMEDDRRSPVPSSTLLASTSSLHGSHSHHEEKTQQIFHVCTF